MVVVGAAPVAVVGGAGVVVVVVVVGGDGGGKLAVATPSWLSSPRHIGHGGGVAGVAGRG